MLKENIVLVSAHDEMPISTDLVGPGGSGGLPVVLMIHGFCGYKDWGALNLLADAFAEAGFLFVKCNLSHNGTSLTHPTEFVDLKAFEKDTPGIQMDDVGVVIEYLLNSDEGLAGRVDPERLFLMGHSRGGAIALAKAAEDSRVKGVVTLAAGASFAHAWTPELLAEWKRTGYRIYTNSRTGQELPVGYGQVTEYQANSSRYDLEQLLPSLDIPLLFFHCGDDDCIPLEHVHRLHSWAPDAEVVTFKSGGHTFGDQEPWEGKQLPTPCDLAAERAMAFLTR